MPKDTIALLEEALLLRQRFWKWFADNCPDSICSNKNHAFFNSQLELILNLFRLPSPSSPSTSTGTIPSNSFSVLQQDTNLADVPEINANPKAPRSQAVNINTEDPICVPFEDGHLFELFCLFHDANEIRTYLTGIWRRYKDRKVDLITASLTTQVAFRRFIDQEVAFAQKYPSLEYLGLMIGSVFVYIATGESSLWTGTMEAVESKRVMIHSAMEKWESSRELDEWTFRPISVILEKMAVLDQMKVLGKREQRDQLLTELLTPKYGHCVGDFRRLLDFFDATPTQQVKSPLSPLDSLDPLVFRFRQPPVGGRIHISTALMCRVFLDISGQEVSDIAMADGRTLKGYVDAQKGYINPDGQTHLQKIIDLLETPVAALHPVVAGTAVFRMLYNTQSLTVNVENASWRLMSAAHLYNWFRVFDNEFPRWPDMEKMIDLQQVEIFAASERPKTGEKCCKRFWMARGLKLEDIHEHSTTDTLEEAASKRSVPLIQFYKIGKRNPLTLARSRELLELYKKKRTHLAGDASYFSPRFSRT
ncbi:hypothetical protein CSOJ01_11491 [Colletotrichum sojae]|uniref:DUF6604 domain-containing protein n=1 Tax=Colletotrichum sojae TaxID=2175907 RepID=A0A8H6MNR4_9PEZI|nr:hypothetical protein CSOJ01_11491 [Colletotrichum sojae]